MKGLLRRIWAKLAGPVCQNKNAVMFGNYGDAIVRFYPVVDSDGVVTEWIPDPDSVKRLEEAAAFEAAQRAMPAQPAVHGPPALPPQVPGGSAGAGGFNPAAVAGL